MITVTGNDFVSLTMAPLGECRVGGQRELTFVPGRDRGSRGRGVERGRGDRGRGDRGRGDSSRGRGDRYQPHLFCHLFVLRTVLLALHSSPLQLKCMLVHVVICAILQVYNPMKIWIDGPYSHKLRLITPAWSSD